ncbi:MAG TPA: hypothetical protein VIJ86_09530 [Acidimicrobiales bacterium]
MAIRLIRSESAGDLRILAATGASSRTRRHLTGATAGALALVAAIAGTSAADLAMIGFGRTSALDGISSLASVPVANLLAISVATIVGSLTAWREPKGVSAQVIQ